MNALPLQGRTVLVTGTITGLTRDEAKSAVLALGGTPAAGVSGKVDLIVLGEGAGISKTAKARTLGIPALHGGVFAALHADPGSWDGAPVGLGWAEYETAHPDEPDTLDDTAPGTYGSRAPADPAHWVGKAVLHIVGPDGARQRQVRLGCACGHKWMRSTLGGDDTCPRPAAPVTVAPWATSL